MNIFIIGAGALGCELVKHFALMGISTNKNSQSIITDNDRIETSNLNRQFLFRNKDIGKSKSKIASEQAKIMNREINCKYLEMFVNDESEEYFNEKFWENQNFIFTAVDSKSARKYVDNQCTKYSKHLMIQGLWELQQVAKLLSLLKLLVIMISKKFLNFQSLCVL